MGQAEEVEVGPIRFRMTRALCHLWAEIDEACLVGMERESVAKSRGGEELRRLRPAAIDVPADQILAAGRGHVMAGGRPGDPGLGIPIHEQADAGVSGGWGRPSIVGSRR